MNLKVAGLSFGIAVVLLTGAGAAPAPAAGMQPGVKTFKEPEILTADSTRMNVLRTQLRLADTRIMNYMQQSMASVQQGHRNGLQYFAVWYRKRKTAEETSTVEIAKAIVKEALGKGLELIFPESTPFVEAIKFTGKTSMAVADKMLKVPKDDVNFFLEQVRTAEEEHIRKLLDTPADFRKTHAAELDAAKYQYLDVWMQDETKGPEGQDLPPSVQKMIDALGVPPPGSETAMRVAEGVLISHIHTIYANDESVVQGAGPHSLWDFAEIDGLMAIDRKGNTKRVCEVQRRLNPFFRPITQKECDAAQ